jgi:hypothetical protein
LKKQIPAAVLLTRNGEGHGSDGLGGEAQQMIDAFFGRWEDAGREYCGGQLI